MTAQSAGKPDDSPRRRPLPGRIIVTSLKILLWTALALLLTVSATLICTVRMLRPERLTPLVEAAAEKALDADLSLSRVEFKFRPEYHGLGIEIDSLLVISKVFDNLPPERRAALPAYADTLAGVGSMTASISLPALVTGRIDLRDIVLRRPMLNIVLDGTGMNNFNIFTAADSDTTDTGDTGSAALPDISVSRFALESPRAIRYFNAADSTDATILLLGGIDVANRPEPDYTLHVDGRLNSPMVRRLVAVDGLSLGLDGRLVWTPRQPSLMAVEDIRLRVDSIEVHADAAVDFGEALMVNSARVNLQPVAVRNLLRYVPDSLLRACSLTPPGFSTDASLAASVELTRPFNLDTDSIPYATASLLLSPSALRYGKARFDNVALDLRARLAGNNLDSATVEIRSFDVAGPATALTLRGTATALVSDPAFKLCLKGRSDLSKLPPVLTDAIGGNISGRVRADVDVDGRMSMFAANTFHLLKIDGSVDVERLRYSSADTVTTALVENAAFRFDSKRQFRRRDGSMSEHMLTTSLKIDTVGFLSDGMAVAASGIGLGLGAENSGRQIDSTMVLPMGGAVKVARLKVSSAADSAMMRLRGLGGFLSLRRFKGADKLPELIFRLNADRLAAGDPSTRLMLRKAQIALTAHKKPARRRRIPADIRMAVDSISRVRPELSTDSVYRLAFAGRRRHNQMRRQRAQDALTADEREIIDWGTSGAMRRFLLRWDFKGSVTTERGRLFTAYFPLRNRVRKLRIDFSTDSILLKGVEYSAGHSDMLVDGRISNIRRSFTGRGHRSPLKIDVRIQSDTIDVNELAASVFAGASYAEHIRRGGRSASFSAAGDDETELENSLEAMVSEQSDSTGPLLVPTNIEADIDVSARNILYSDLAFTDFRGKLMVYDGALNLHRLSARSDIGSVALGALYDAPSARSMKFGFGLNVKQLQLDRFLSLMPAVDSIVPMMRNFSGIINANVAATVDIDRDMNLVMPTLNAAVGLSGDSLRIIDPETYRMIGKWLLFKDKKNDRIKHVNVEFIVENNMLQLYPFTFDIDRYRLGVQGYNDLALNFNYHVSVLKSPLPFKFGITAKGTPDDYKIRIGRAKFKEGAVAEQRAVVDTVRVNLITQIENVFRRGVSRSKFATVNVGRRPPRMSATDDSASDTLSRADSIALIREGIIPGKLPVDTIAETPQAVQPEKGKKTQKKKRSRR